MSDKIKVLFYYIKFKWSSTRLSRKHIDKLKQKRIYRHLKRTTKTIPFYKDFKGKEISQLPVIDKAIFMDNFEQLNKYGISEKEAVEFAIEGERSRDFSKSLKGITVGLSSGTSGRRGVFLVSDKERNMWAGYILSHFLPKGILKGCSIAFFMRANSNLYESVSSKKVCFKFFDLFEEMDKHILALNEMHPDILVGQPWVLLALADEKRQGRLQISPAKIISIAEVLEEKDGEKIKEAFCVKVVHQAYQCTEGCLALTCAYGNLHINENILHVEKEYIDTNRFVPVITDFTRETQPIIRYRLNDILWENKEPCPCGCNYLRIEKIEGREDDVFVFDRMGDTKTVDVFPDFIRRCVLFAGEISNYRVVQNLDKSIEIYSDASEEQKISISSEFKKMADERDFVLPEITFLSYNFDKGHKLKRVERQKGGR